MGSSAANMKNKLESFAPAIEFKDYPRFNYATNGKASTDSMSISPESISAEIARLVMDSIPTSNSIMENEMNTDKPKNYNWIVDFINKINNACDNLESSSNVSNARYLNDLSFHAAEIIGLIRFMPAYHDLIPALKDEDSYGVTHGSLHTRSLRRVPASQGLRLGSLQNPHV